MVVLAVLGQSAPPLCLIVGDLSKSLQKHRMECLRQLTSLAYCDLVLLLQCASAPAKEMGELATLLLFREGTDSTIGLNRQSTIINMAAIAQAA